MTKVREDMCKRERGREIVCKREIKSERERE
jgi:hypothetical protein